MKEIAVAIACMVLADGMQIIRLKSLREETGK